VSALPWSPFPPLALSDLPLRFVFGFHPQCKMLLHQLPWDAQRRVAKADFLAICRQVVTGNISLHTSPFNAFSNDQRHSQRSC
jgi:hypothetical protein